MNGWKKEEETVKEGREMSSKMPGPFLTSDRRRDIRESVGGMFLNLLKSKMRNNKTKTEWDDSELRSAVAENGAVFLIIGHGGLSNSLSGLSGRASAKPRRDLKCQGWGILSGTPAPPAQRKREEGVGEVLWKGATGRRAVSGR